MIKHLSVCLIIFWSNTVFAQKFKEPSPILDSLTPQSKTVIIKRAKNIYKLPCGYILDFNNYEIFLDVIRRNFVSGKDAKIRACNETKAWNILDSGPGFRGPGPIPFVQMFFNNKEQPSLYLYHQQPYTVNNQDKTHGTETAEGRAVWTGYFVKYPTNEKHGKPAWTIELTNINGIYLFKYLVYQVNKNDTYIPKVEFYCEIQAQEVQGSNLKGTSYLLLPCATIEKKQKGTKEKPIEYFGITSW